MKEICWQEWVFKDFGREKWVKFATSLIHHFSFSFSPPNSLDTRQSFSTSSVKCRTETGPMCSSAFQDAKDP
jgi:hypothetical protein